MTLSVPYKISKVRIIVERPIIIIYLFIFTKKTLYFKRKKKKKKVKKKKKKNEYEDEISITRRVSENSTWVDVFARDQSSKASISNSKVT